MSDVNQLNLFGLDLSGLYRRAVLGVQQVLWGDEVGLKAWFCPAVEYHPLENLDTVAYPALKRAEGNIQVVLPESQVLVTQLNLPASAEIFLNEAVAAHVESRSPFSEDETAWGCKIVDRAGGSLAIEVIIVARSTANDASSAVRQALSSSGTSFGLSARTGRAYVALDGYQGSDLDAPYIARLRRFALRLVAGVSGIAFLSVIPVIWTAQTAQQYDDMLQATERRVKDIVRVREALVETQGRVAEARGFMSGHASYRPWLHRLSAVTPDAVYLNRLSIEGNVLTVSGLAVNAADYQAVLAEAGLFSEVTAPAAFTLDNRANRERFTLTMVFAPESDQ